ncbi:DUF99 family protein [Candidatus Woesearchaeota archaeon]|nr:DUF99 family protein [Candidatus Woesearchaeota archaeon]
MIKKEARILGIDDGPFVKGKKQRVLVVGTLFRGGSFLDGLLSTNIAQDGNDATRKLVKMINRCKFRPQIQCIMLDGIALGGFNVIDIHQLYEKTRIPVITVIRTMPNMQDIRGALSHVKDGDKKWALLSTAPVVRKIGHVYCQWMGIPEKKVLEFIRTSTTHGNMPEPIRIAHIIARGIVTGESKGGA